MKVKRIKPSNPGNSFDASTLQELSKHKDAKFAKGDRVIYQGKNVSIMFIQGKDGEPIRGKDGNIIYMVGNKGSGVAASENNLKFADSNDRTYSEVTGPYRKSSMVVKKKKRKLDGDTNSIKVSDVRMYGELTPKEAGVVLDIYEENGRFSDTKSAQSLKNKGYITVSKVPSGSTPGEGVLTSKGEQWVKDFHGGKFDSEEILSNNDRVTKLLDVIDSNKGILGKNLGTVGGTHLGIDEGTGRFLMSQGDNAITISKVWMKKVIKTMQEALDKM